MRARSGASPPLDIQLLGGLMVRRGIDALDLPSSRKTRALLAYLVATGRPQLRDSLCELLWDGPDDPRAALRWSLTKIRPLLDDAACQRLVAAHDRVCFEPHGARIDLADVQAGAGPAPEDAPTERLQAAVERFGGDLLDGLDLPGCPRYHEWWVAEREVVRHLRLRVLTVLVDRLRHRPEEALRYARARLVVDPFAETAHVAVIELLSALGRTRDALQQYETCRRVLDEELGARPSAALERARAALGGGPSGGRIRPSAGGSSARGPSLAGRRLERATIADLIAAARADHPRAVLLITGEPGIGKTRLLEEAADQVRAAGGRVLSGRAFEAEMVRPYGAWIDALRHVGAAATPRALWPALAPLVPELGDSSAAVADRGRLFESVAQLLTSLAAAAPVALVLDDVQWFDEASAALLHFVGRTNTPRLVIACAARRPELDENAAAATLVRALRRDGRLNELPLGPLDAAATAELVHAGGAAVDTARVFAESEGNPLFAIEIARARAAGDSKPATLAGLLHDRLERLDAAAKQVLPWAAGLGRKFTLQMLRAVTELAPTDLLSAVEQLERHGVLRASTAAGDAYDFAHDLVREAAYARLSEPRRRLIHQHIARALDSLSDRDEALASDVAHHAALGGDPERAARAAITAGERCLRLFAHAEAAELAARATREIASLPRAVRLPLHMALLRIAVHAGVAGRRARELATEVSRVVIEAQDAGLATEVAAGFYLLSFMHHYGGDFAAAQENSLRAAEAGRSADPLTLARTLGDTGRCLAQLERDLPRAEALLAEARELAAGAGVSLTDIPWGLGLIRAYEGAYDEAVALLDDALRLARREQDHWAECECLARLATIELERGRPVDALARATDFVAVAARMGEGSEAPFAAVLHALARATIGETGADAALERALAILRAVDAKALLSRALTFAAALELERGRLAEADALAAEAVASAEAVGRRSEVVVGRVLRARAALVRGDRSAAAVHAQAIASDMAAPAALAGRARALLPLLRLEL